MQASRPGSGAYDPGRHSVCAPVNTTHNPSSRAECSHLERVTQTASVVTLVCDNRNGGADRAVVTTRANLLPPLVIPGPRTSAVEKWSCLRAGSRRRGHTTHGARATELWSGIIRIDRLELTHAIETERACVLSGVTRRQAEKGMGRERERNRASK
jgi:hypothetical protein